MTFRKILLLLCTLPGMAWAVDLEDSPDRDIEQVDRAAEQQATKIKTVEFQVSPGKPVLDGILDEDFWGQAKSFSINMELYPERFAKPLVETEILAAVSATHLYLGFTAYDPDMESLRSVPRARDGVKNDDYVSVVVDPTGNLRRKFEFRVNPHGGIADVLQNAVSNRYIYDWDTRWDSAAKINDGSWVVEMAIPLDSIKKPPVEAGKPPQWLVLFKRAYPRAVDHTLGSVYLFQVSGSDGLFQRKRKLEVIPYAIFDLDEEREDGEPFEQVLDHDNYDAGGDLKLIFDSATALAATIRPNYTEVEADIARASINNPFTPFQPEKREFFHEGKDLYSSFMPVIYTRNIIQPDIGLNFTHSGRRLSAGAMWVNDEFTSLIMPDNLGSDSVELMESSRSMAMRYTTGEKGSANGAMITARTGDDYSNYVAGFDGLHNFSLDDKLRYQVMYSWTDYPESFAEDLCNGDDCGETATETSECTLGECAVTPYVLRASPGKQLSGHGLRLSYKHDSPNSLWWLNYSDYADDFRADLGIESRTDYRKLNLAYGRNWFFNTRKQDKGKSRVRGYLVGNLVESNRGEQIENGVDFWGEFRGSFQTVLRAGYRLKERAVNRIDQSSLALGDNAPLFDESYWQWYLETAPFSSFILNLDGRFGEIADASNLVLGHMTELKPKIKIFAGRYSFELAHTYRDYDLDEERLYRENFLTLQGIYYLRDDHIFRLLLLADQTDRDTSRFLKDELALENEDTLELTYLHRKSPGLSILAGAKIKQEKTSETSTFTSDREVYVKLVYDFTIDLPF